MRVQNGQSIVLAAGDGEQSTIIRRLLGSTSFSQSQSVYHDAYSCHRQEIIEETPMKGPVSSGIMRHLPESVKSASMER